MRKRLSLLLATVCVLPAAQLKADCCECDVNSHTFFSVRPQYQSASPEKTSLFRDRMNARENGRGGAFQLTMFGGRSTNTSDLRHFFFPDCKDKLTTSEAFNSADIDLDAIHFDVASKNLESYLLGLQQDPTPFESSITMCPRQSVFGIGMTYRQNLSQLMDEDAERDYQWWFEISSPLTRVKNDLQFKETVVTDMESAGGVLSSVDGLPEDQLLYSNMTEAFKQSAWKYGKIDTCARTKWRLADIELKLGVEMIKEEGCRLEGYIGLLVPTGNKVCAEYMFEPIVGHNRHWGLMKGGKACFELWADDECDRNVRCAFDVHGMYLFSKCEKRSFDLKGRPWSRYVKVYENKAQAQEAYDLNQARKTVAANLLATPGINLFTQDLKVKPGLQCNSNAALIYTNGDNGFQGEFGYNFFVRQKECVELNCKWNSEAAVRGSLGAGTTTRLNGIVDNNSFLNIVGEADAVLIDQDLDHYEENIITSADLDLESAAHPAVFSHTLYLSLGKRWEPEDECGYPTFLGGGGSYEFGFDNSVLNRWLLWIKGGISF